WRRTTRTVMTAPMLPPCRTPEAPVNRRSRQELGTQAVLERDPGGLFLEPHRLVDRKHRPVGLVVPRLDVVDTQPLRVRHGPKLQRHGDASATCFAPDTGEALPAERLV